MIGDAIGVAAVIAVVSLINGTNQYAATKVFNLEADAFALAKPPSIIINGFPGISETEAHHHGPSRRHSRSDKPDDFAISTSGYFLDLWNKIRYVIFVPMFAVASLASLVGGIGVMNIMLDSVTKRTGEIGVRKAIGAKRVNILLQFLMEAVPISALGGVFGVVCGALLSLLLRYGLHFPAALSLF